MKRRSLRGVILSLGVCALGAASDAGAQSADILAVSAWRFHFEYTLKASIDSGEQQVDFQVTATGDGVLERDPDGASPRNFRGEPNVNVQLSYAGAVTDPQGCGLMESLTSSGAALCTTPTHLYVNGDGTFELDPGCGRVAVAHAFKWTGPCGPLFEYPVDGDAITDWGWQVQDNAFGSMPRMIFPLPAQGTALSGSDSGAPMGLDSSLFTAIATGAKTPVDYTFSFTLTPAAQEDLTLEIDAPLYDTWRPTTTASADPGTPLPVTARLKTKTGRDPEVRVTAFVWNLKDTSREPGVAMNFPIDAADTAFDLELGTPGDTHAFDADRQQAERFDPGGFTDAIDVVPLDWGGWSTLTVTAVLSDGRRIVGKRPDAGEEGARIPKRAATSLIADFWKESRHVGGKTDDADDDATPVGDGTKGDGLNLYQEYRGFYGGGEHREGDPVVKDFFVLNRARGVATAGLARFKRLSKLNVQPWLREDEMPATRVINANHAASPAGTPQHAVIMEIIPGLYGWCEATDGPGSPGKIWKLVLQEDWPIVKAEAWPSLVAHELFHCVNVWHHGDSDRQQVPWRAVDATQAEPAQLLEEGGGPGTGTEIHTQNEGGGDTTADTFDRAKAAGGARLVWIGVDQGQHSGDDRCVMRYSNADAYVKRADPTVRIEVTDSRGPGLCRSSEGTGVNSASWQPQSRFGAAAMGRGNCEHQIHVTDAVPAPIR